MPHECLGKGFAEGIPVVQIPQSLMLSYPSALEEGGEPAVMISSNFFFWGLASVFCIAADKIPLGVGSLLLSLVTFYSWKPVN